MHHFGFRISGEREIREFLEACIPLSNETPPPRGGIVTSFDISESDPKWADAARLAAKFKAIEIITTRFTELELASARYLGIFASSHRGYPEPSQGMGYMEETFDLSDHCSRCGIGCRQVRPFRAKKLPRLGNSLMQLNWVFDEFFVSPEVWARIFEPRGIGCQPVLLDGSEGKIHKSIVQLEISEQIDLELSESDAVNCPRCGRPKWPVSLRGFLPKPGATRAAIFKSSQFFGNGADAFRFVLVSNSLYRVIKESCLRGLEFYPCGPAL